MEFRVCMLVVHNKSNSNSSVIVKDGEREWLRIDGEVRQGFFMSP